MIIRLHNSETGDETFINIFNGGTTLPLNNENIRKIIRDYEEHYMYSSTINGLISHLMEMGYTVNRVKMHDIEFGY